VISHAISHYRIIKKLGAGGMGEVYLAEDTRLGRKVAIKLLPQKSLTDEQAKKRLVREAKAAAVLDHPNICAIHEVGEEGDTSFIIMQYVEGETLSDRLRAKGLSLKESIDIAMQVADALTEAHSRGIVHRDIKPQNIIITPRGAVKVLDFGLAKIVQQDLLEQTTAETASLITESNVIVGTAPYMSPEQVKRGRIDGRSDLFSLGAMLYECVAGKQAFTGANAMEICAQVLYLDPPTPSRLDARVPTELDRLILKAIAKKADARYQTAAEMIADLQRVRDELQAEESLPTQQVAIKPATSRVLALATLSNRLKRPGIILPIVLAIPLIAIIFFWAVPRFRASAPYQPSLQAKRWYDTGVNALRDGTYYQASRALEQAIKTDEKFALAHARLAEALMELDYTDRAREEQLQALSLVSDHAPLSPTDDLYLRAVNFTLTRNLAEAVATYREITNKAQASEKQYAYLDLGRAYEKNEEIDKAIESYTGAIKLDPQYAAAFLRLGMLHGRKRDLQTAVGAFNDAERLYEAASNFEGVTESFYQRGYLFNKMGMIADAQTQFQKVVDRTRSTGNKYQQIKTLLQLSSISYTEGKTVQAKQLAAEALDLARANGLENLTTEGLIDLGNAFFVRREYNEAENYYRQALEFAQRSKGRRSEALAHMSLGKLYMQQEENTDEGLRLIEKALEFYRQGGYAKEVSQALLLHGQGKLQKGDYEGALNVFTEQLEMAQHDNDQVQIARSHLLIGSLHVDQELYPDALRHFEESCKIYETLGSQLNLGYSLLDRSNMLWRLGNYANAQGLFEQAVSLANRLDSKYRGLLFARISLAKAQMALSERRLPEAKAASRQALEFGSEHNRTLLEAKSTLGLAMSLSGAKREGKLLCKEAVDMTAREVDPRLLSAALLALSETLLINGENQAALDTALRAQEKLARSGQNDSGWRALVIAALAYQKLGDFQAAQKYISKAIETLSRIQSQWGTELFGGYMSRPDIQIYRKLLNEPVAQSRN
jgi:tetratricopeptide (TPR) repeat protein/tRNA A-37 threonylcarbamoyl transferase component Bud32